MKLVIRTILTTVLAIGVVTVIQNQNPALAQSSLVYELRTYTTAPGRLQALLNRFENGEIDLFIKHGMTSVGYWIPDDEALSQNTLVYMVAHESRTAATESWAAFGSDPDWQEMWNKSLEDGPIVVNVVNQFLDPTGFSPAR